MKNICLNFRVHCPVQLVHYPFSNIGENHYYFDDERNANHLLVLAKESFLPANYAMNKLINKYGDKFNFSFSISGTTLDLMEVYHPKLLKSFQQLSGSGNVEFTSEPYFHSFSSIKSKHEFSRQLRQYEQRLLELFGQKPNTFRNTALTYTNYIDDVLLEHGYKNSLITENQNLDNGQSPNYLFHAPSDKSLHFLMKNEQLSSGITGHFSGKHPSNTPHSVEEYIHLLNNLPEEEQLVNIWIDYAELGQKSAGPSKVLDFMVNFVDQVIYQGKIFFTPSQTQNIISGKSISVPCPSTNHGERLSSWLSNEMQQEAFDTLYEIEPQVMKSGKTKIKKFWSYLQSIDHLYYMNMSNLDKPEQIPYNTPFEAFINYMNILSDLKYNLKNTAEQSLVLGLEDLHRQKMA